MSELFDFLLTTGGITDAINSNPGETLDNLNVEAQSAAMAAGFISGFKPTQGIASGFASVVVGDMAFSTGFAPFGSLWAVQICLYQLFPEQISKTACQFERTPCAF